MAQAQSSNAQPADNVMKLDSFVRGKWTGPGETAAEIHSAVTGDVVALATRGDLDMREVLAYGRTVGSKNLRKLTFHERAGLLKKLADYLTQHKDRLYKLSFHAGCTKTDAMVDVDGGIGTLYS